MLIKWIVCDVPEDKKQQFSDAQEKWKPINKINGFLGQIGGWDIDTPTKACVISFWKDHSSYQFFMEHKHDDIFKENEQQNTYENITVEIFEKNLNLSDTNITQILKKPEILRIAHCIVKEEKQNHFEDMQKVIWNDGMSKVQGMLAGAFCKNNHTTYLVVSLWRNRDSHQKYVSNTFPLLVEQSKVKDDLVQFEGTLVELDRDWSVI
ncbi:YdbC family protein [Jeotgalibacillus marinus]|uniref:YdbC family protein n=1 Tax=Jeotgalibacillus marinus TaxID=86667 RepID=A0ABV3Q5C3_9BACL